MARRAKNSGFRLNKQSRTDETHTPSETRVEATIDALAVSQSPSKDWDTSVDDVMGELSGDKRLEDVGLLDPDPKAKTETVVNSVDPALKRERRRGLSGKRGGRRWRSKFGFASWNTESERDPEKYSGIVVGFVRRFRLSKWRKYAYFRELAKKHADACARRDHE